VPALESRKGDRDDANAIPGILDFEVLPLVTVNLAVNAEITIGIVEFKEQPGLVEWRFVVIVSCDYLMEG